MPQKETTNAPVEDIKIIIDEILKQHFGINGKSTIHR